MNLLIKHRHDHCTCFCLPQRRSIALTTIMRTDIQEHPDHEPSHLQSRHPVPRPLRTVLTRTEDIESALAEGGEPIVADVLGVVCDSARWP